MTAYNFQKRFVPLIESGQKASTIRAARPRGNPRPGGMLQLYFGMRTKGCRLIREAPCTAVRPIIIDSTTGKFKVILDNVLLDYEQVSQLAIRDGFKDAGEFARFFEQMYPMPANLWLIEWRA